MLDAIMFLKIYRFGEKSEHSCIAGLTRILTTPTYHGSAAIIAAGLKDRHLTRRVTANTRRNLCSKLSLYVQEGAAAMQVATQLT
jgi:hypothetical protein